MEYRNSLLPMNALLGRNRFGLTHLRRVTQPQADGLLEVNPLEAM
jgi:hypothetical protein